jgi:hypothetical protein
MKHKSCHGTINTAAHRHQNFTFFTHVFKMTCKDKIV